MSKTIEDLFRPLNGPLANKDPIALKPPYRVPRASEQDVNIPHYPMGILTIRVRMLGTTAAVDEFASNSTPYVDWATDGEFVAVDKVVKSEWMKWAIVETLVQVISLVGGVKITRDDVLLCADGTDVLSVTLPSLGDAIWQICDFRFDYKLRMQRQDAPKVIRSVFDRMVEFEERFCTALELQFRNIYRLTVMQLVNKSTILMDGAKATLQCELFEAAQSNDLERMSAIFRHNVDVNARPSAAKCLVQLLGEELRHVFVELGRPPLLAAAEKGHLQAIQVLIAAEADVNIQDNAGSHALYLAAGAECGSEQAVNLLLSLGADVNLANESGFTPLHNACGSGEPLTIKALIQSGADANLRSNSGTAPVHVAVTNKQPRSLQALKDCGANLDQPAFGGNTPIHEAVMQNDAAMIKTLFDLGADINVQSGPSNDLATPLRMATDRKKKKAANVLKELGALEDITAEVHA